MRRLSQMCSGPLWRSTSTVYMAMVYPHSPRSIRCPAPLIIERAAEYGDPVTERGHKRQKPDKRQVGQMKAALKRHPTATNRDLARAAGGGIAERTVSDYLARTTPPYTTKVIQDQEPEEFRESWQAGCRKWLRRVADIPLDTRIYADESFIYENEAKTRGRSPKGKPIFRARPKYAKKYTLHVYAKRSGVVDWELRKVNASTQEVVRAASWAADYMTEGDTLFWDRLGRSGRCKNLVAQHYSPDARQIFADAGVKLEFLPPKAKYFDPVELLFSDLKSHYIRPAYPGNGQKLSFDAIKSIVATYMDECAPTKLPGFFRARANGRDAIKRKLL